jgi:hypothetical protein
LPADPPKERRGKPLINPQSCGSEIGSAENFWPLRARATEDSEEILVSRKSGPNSGLEKTHQKGVIWFGK